MAPQITQHEFQGMSRAHGDGIRVHQAAGGVLIEG